MVCACVRAGVCVCVCARARVGMSVCVCVCVCVCSCLRAKINNWMQKFIRLVLCHVRAKQSSVYILYANACSITVNTIKRHLLQ